MLTDPACRHAACPPGKPRARFADSGGLYLEVSPAGSKRWFWKYRAAGTERRMALGSYPDVSLKDARSARDAAKLQRKDGIDPVQAKLATKARANAPAGETFKVVALEWYDRQAPNWSPAHADRSKRQFERDLFPWLGARPLADIQPTELLATLRKVEARGAVETADRGLMLCRQVWRYAVATGRASRDITGDLKGAITPYRGKSFPAITDPKLFAQLLRAIKGYRGGSVVRAALQLAPLVFVRPGELRAATWSEFDLDAGVWQIPSARMKRTKHQKENGQPHTVPLATQAVAILRDLHVVTGHGRMVFPGERSHERPMSDNSVRTALIAMGYSPDVHTWHGFRASARTMLAEVLAIDPLVIEAQLAHAVKDANGRAYNRTTYLPQRVAMMQRWADYCDELAAAGGA